jgi:hypothetical protein
MNEPIPGCPCGHPDFRVEIDISAVIVVKPEEVALAIEGCSTHAWGTSSASTVTGALWPTSLTAVCEAVTMKQQPTVPSPPLKRPTS